MKELTITHRVVLSPKEFRIDGQPLERQNPGWEALTETYKKEINDYPRYYKMDPLCRLGFVASELLLRAEGLERFRETARRGVLLFNRSGSLMADKAFEATIADADNHFPSPSAFVYTLPNIVTGEIAIRNHYHGETDFMLLPQCDWKWIDRICQAHLSSGASDSLLTGWVEVASKEDFLADLRIVK